MIIGINESKIFAKHVPCRCEFRFGKWNSGKYKCECKNLKEHHVCKKNYIWNPATCSYENDKNLASTTAQKKYSFPLRMYPVNATKAAVSCGLCPIYWRNPK